MLTLLVEVPVNATLSTLWQHYVQLDLRKKWEIDLENMEYEGEIKTGTYGTVQLSHMPPMRFLLTKVEENKEITDEVVIPEMGTLAFCHQMVEKNNATYLAQTVTLKPASGQATEKELGFFKQVTSDVTDTVFRLKKVVEQA